MDIERPKSRQPIPDHAKRVFKGVIFDVYQWEQEMYDGARTIFEKVKRTDVVVVFPVLPDGKYEAEEFILWDAQQPMNKVDWAVYTFIAKGLKKVGDMCLDGGEKIKLFSATLDELIDLATSSEDRKFGEKEIIYKLFRAKLDPKKYEELKELFKPMEK